MAEVVHVHVEGRIGKYLTNTDEHYFFRDIRADDAGPMAEERFKAEHGEGSMVSIIVIRSYNEPIPSDVM